MDSEQRISSVVQGMKKVVRDAEKDSLTFTIPVVIDHNDMLEFGQKAHIRNLVTFIKDLGAEHVAIVDDSHTNAPKISRANEFSEDEYAYIEIQASGNSARVAQKLRNYKTVLESGCQGGELGV